jgi:hypothetical protein
MRHLKTVVGLCTLLTAYGCAMESGGEGEGFESDASTEDGENLGSVSQAAIDEKFAIGVLPVALNNANNSLEYSTTCPAGSPLITLNMDDEDDDPQTDWWGFFSSDYTVPNQPNALNAPWGSPTTARRAVHGKLFFPINTMFRFCKVNGNSFKPLTTDVNAKGRFYAVLKLGTTCPNGSFDFTRHIDNEDTDPATSVTGPIAPSVVGANTTLRLCFFRTGVAANLMTAFPNLGINYAVFHDFDTTDQKLFLQKHWRYTDDEDSGNANSTSPSGTSEAADFAAIISSGSNTMWDIGRVK